MIAVIGPTASGKSDLAIDLAQKFGGEVISADSRQIYRGMDIGTGKEPGRVSTHSKKRGRATQYTYICDGIPHYMIDIVHPNTQYNAGKFVKKAACIRDDIVERDQLPIICGGTFFWAQSLTEGQRFPPVPPNKELRKDLLQKKPKDLFRLLENIDPKRAQTIDKNNPARLIRSIEIATTLGAVPKVKKNIDKKNILIIAIDHLPEKLNARIEKRLTKRLAAGMLDEVSALHHDQKVSWKRLESFGLEYKWCALYLQGKVSYVEMHEKLLRNIKRYAKRQRTWIRKWQREGTFIHTIANDSQAESLTKSFLNED